MVGLSGGGGDWFWGESPVMGLNSGGEGLQLADFFTIYTGHARRYR